MRLFIAISASEINFDLNMALNKLWVNLNRLGFDYRWIPQENYHVTLNLLGKILDPKIELLKAMLFEIAPYERQSFGEIEVKTLTLYRGPVWGSFSLL